MPPIGADVRLPGCDRTRIAPQGPLEAYGYGTGPGTVIHDDGHLDDALDRRTDEDAPDARLTRPAEQGAEFADPLSGLFCGPGRELPGRARSCQRLGQNLSELIRPPAKDCWLSPACPPREPGLLVGAVVALNEDGYFGRPDGGRFALR
jgi:hypothetical protein